MRREFGCGRFYVGSGSSTFRFLFSGILPESALLVFPLFGLLLPDPYFVYDNLYYLGFSPFLVVAAGSVFCARQSVSTVSGSLCTFMCLILYLFAPFLTLNK